MEQLINWAITANDDIANSIIFYKAIPEPKIENECKILERWPLLVFRGIVLWCDNIEKYRDINHPLLMIVVLRRLGNNSLLVHKNYSRWMYATKLMCKIENKCHIDFVKLNVYDEDVTNFIRELVQIISKIRRLQYYLMHKFMVGDTLYELKIIITELKKYDLGKQYRQPKIFHNMDSTLELISSLGI